MPFVVTLYNGYPGEFGTAVRSEALVLTDAIISEAYSTTPECFQATPDWSTNYPATFEGLLQNNDERLGYKDRRTGFPNHEPGWYIEGGRMKYDWQDVTIEHSVGLMLESKDVFDNTSTVAYDDYSLLPETTRQFLKVLWKIPRYVSR